jgi:hypothetical protein
MPSSCRISEPFTKRTDTAKLIMGILARLFHFHRDESVRTRDGGDVALDDRAVLAHIADNDEDPDVRKAARELLDSGYSLRRE